MQTIYLKLLDIRKLFQPLSTLFFSFQSVKEVINVDTSGKIQWRPTTRVHVQSIICVYSWGLRNQLLLPSFTTTGMPTLDTAHIAGGSELFVEYN